VAVRYIHTRMYRKAANERLALLARERSYAPDITAPKQQEWLFEEVVGGGARRVVAGQTVSRTRHAHLVTL